MGSERTRVEAGAQAGDGCGGRLGSRQKRETGRRDWQAGGPDDHG